MSMRFVVKVSFVAATLLTGAVVVHYIFCSAANRCQTTDLGPQLPTHRSSPQAPAPSAGTGQPPLSEADTEALIALFALPGNLAAARLADKFTGASESARRVILQRLSEHLSKDANPAVRVQCATCLAWCGPKAVEALLSALNADPDVGVRSRAAASLGQAGGRPELPHLYRAIQAEIGAAGRPGDVSFAAIGSIGDIGGPEASILLMALWQDPRLIGGARERTIMSMGTAGSKVSLGVVMHALHGSDRDPGMRSAATFALAAIARCNQEDGAVVSSVRTVMRKGLLDKDRAVRVHAADGLSSVGDRGDVHVLRGLEQSDPDLYVQRAAGVAANSIEARLERRE